MEAEKEKSRPAGGVFKYLNVTCFDLDRYGIHKEINRKKYNENCLYLALEAGGMCQEKLEERLKSFIMNRVVPKCKLKDVCEKLDIYIKLTTLRNDLSGRTESYGKKYAEENYNIGLLDEHYFLIEPTNLSAFCLKNYEEIKHLPNCNNIVRKLSETKYKRDNSTNIDSFQVVKILLERKETGHLIKPLMFDNELMASQFYDKVEEFKTLEYLDNNVKYQTWQKKDKAKYYKVYFDFETITDKTHKPYLVRYETEGTGGNSSVIIVL